MNSFQSKPCQKQYHHIWGRNSTQKRMKRLRINLLLVISCVWSVWWSEAGRFMNVFSQPHTHSCLAAVELYVMMSHRVSAEHAERSSSLRFSGMVIGLCWLWGSQYALRHEWFMPLDLLSEWFGFVNPLFCYSWSGIPSFVPFFECKIGLDHLDPDTHLFRLPNPDY